MDDPNSIDDSHWPEVCFINGYATFIGFLRIGVKGLGVLVFTWATVVLLGGFVTDLEEEDFWCLTMITLIQTFSAGVFDSLIKGNSSKSKTSWKVLMATAYAMAQDVSIVRKKRRKLAIGSKRRKKVFRGCVTVLNYFLVVVQPLVLAIVLVPLVVVYLAGLYISTGLSLWRLIQRNSGNGDGQANQKPALAVLYLLAVAQGALDSFKALYTWVKGVDLVDEVADRYSMDKRLVSDYKQETMVGCAKDPTFCRERNLVTYALDLLMESKSSDSYLSGVQILGTILERPLWDLWDFKVSTQPGMIKRLLTESASYGHMIQRLIETMGTESPDSRRIRVHAARIVAHVADRINLRYFPKGTEFLSFLLYTVENYQGESDGHHERASRWQHLRDKRSDIKHLPVRPLEIQENPASALPDDELPESGLNYWLVVHCLHIIQNLSADVDNCKMIIPATGLIMSNITVQGLRFNITAPLISDQFHNDHQESEIAEELLKLISWLMATPGVAGKEMRTEMLSGNNEAVIRALKGIIACSKCEVLLIRRAIQIFLHLSQDPSIIIDNRSSSIKITWILLHIFLLPDDCFDKIQGSDHWKKKSSEIGKLAREKLLFLHSEEHIIDSVYLVLGDLAKALVDPGNISKRVHAAVILDHLCFHYTENDDYLKALKYALVTSDVMLQVLREILDSVQPSLQGIDLESGGVTKMEGRNPNEALISLSKTIWWIWYDQDDPHVTSQLDGIAEKICSEKKKRSQSFDDLMYEAMILPEKVDANDKQKSD